MSKCFLVLSDTHQDKEAMQSALPLLLAIKPTALFHLGDVVEDAVYLKKHLPNIEIVSVRGNCDFSSKEPLIRVYETDGIRILVVHGHTLQVKDNLSQLVQEASTQQCSVALYGHTHRANIERQGKILLVNPSSLSRPIGASKGGIALLMVDHGRVEASLLTP